MRWMRPLDMQKKGLRFRKGLGSLIAMLLICCLFLAVQIAPFVGDGSSSRWTAPCRDGDTVSPASTSTSPPSALNYSTYFQGDGPGYSFINDLAVDGEGRAYFIGSAITAYLPSTPDAFQRLPGGQYDAFIGRLSPDGSILEYFSYLGGVGNDSATGIAVDQNGDIYVTGDTDSVAFPTTEGAARRTVQGHDAFVCKFTRGGEELAYSTLVGGSGQDFGIDVAVDAIGSAFVVGRTDSRDLQITPGTGTPVEYNGSAFITKVNASGTVMDYCIYYKYENPPNSGSVMEPQAIGIGEDGRAYIVGLWTSIDYPRSQEAYLVRVEPDGTAVRAIASLYGSGNDAWYDMALVSGRYVYVVGSTSSTNLPLTEPPFGPMPAEHTVPHPILCMMDVSDPDHGAKSVYTVMLGGTHSGYGEGIAVDKDGAAYITGYTSSSDLPVTNCSLQSHFAGWTDAFLTKLAPDGSYLVYSTYMGGRMDDSGHNLAMGAGGDVYIVGRTDGGFPTTSGAYLPHPVQSGKRADFIARFSATALSPPVAEAGPDIVTDQHRVFSLNGTASSDDICVVNWSWTFWDGSANVTLYGPTPKHTLDMVGSYEVTLYVTDEYGNWDVDHLLIHVRDVTPPVPLAPDVVVAQDLLALLDGTDSTDNVGVVNWTWTLEYHRLVRVLYGANANFTFHEVGEYTVTLRTADLAGNAATAPVTVTVIDVTPPVAEAGPDITIDQREVLGFDEMLSTDNVGIWNWTVDFTYDGGSVSLDRSDPSFRFDIVGEYDLNLTVWDRAGNTDSDTVAVKVRDITRPLANAGADIPIDQHRTATLDGTSSSDNVGIVNWTWYFEYDGYSMSLFGPIAGYRFDIPGTYSVRLVVRDAELNEANDDCTVVVRDTTLPMAITGANLTARLGERMLLDGHRSFDDVGIVNWTWTFEVGGKPVVLVGEVTYFVFRNVGNYTVSLTVWDAAGNANSSTMWVRVLPTSTDGTPWGMRPLEWVAIMAIMIALALLLVAMVGARKRRPAC